MNIDVILDAGAIIGESPTWVAAEQALYWIDVKKPALYRLGLDRTRRAASQRYWPMSSDIGAFALTRNLAGAVVALRHGLYHLDFSSSALTELAPPPFDPALFRFNEGACDSLGRFWVGVMFDPLSPTAAPQKASLHSFTLAEGFREAPDAAELHNGMAWSPDERTFYLTHSQKREIHRFTYDVLTGHIGNRRLFAKMPDARELPDGAAVDVDGGYWCALHGAARLRRYFPDGTIDRDVPLPVTQPTMCAFGGKELDQLYVTSATDRMTDAQREREPLAGALLRIQTATRGAPRYFTVEDMPRR